MLRLNPAPRNRPRCPKLFVADANSFISEVNPSSVYNARNASVSGSLHHHCSRSSFTGASVQSSPTASTSTLVRDCSAAPRDNVCLLTFVRFSSAASAVPNRTNDFARAFFADSFCTGNVVNRVAHQRHHVAHSFPAARPATLPLSLRPPANPVCCRLPRYAAPYAAHQLQHVLVARHHDIRRGFAPRLLRQRPDYVVSLIPRAFPESAAASLRTFFARTEAAPLNLPASAAAAPYTPQKVCREMSDRWSQTPPRCIPARLRSSSSAACSKTGREPS